MLGPNDALMSRAAAKCPWYMLLLVLILCCYNFRGENGHELIAEGNHRDSGSVKIFWAASILEERQRSTEGVVKYTTRTDTSGPGLH
jgi:hypothetical protein